VRKTVGFRSIHEGPLDSVESQIGIAKVVIKLFDHLVKLGISLVGIPAALFNHAAPLGSNHP
jgi:hypothetical protein